MAASETPSLVSSEKTVATAGTAVALSATSLRVKSITIVAKDTNTGRVYVGGSDVTSTVNRGLQAGDALHHTSDGWFDLKDLFVNASVNSEGVDFYAVKA